MLAPVTTPDPVALPPRYGTAQAVPASGTNGVAIAALIVGIVALASVGLGYVPEIVGQIFGFGTFLFAILAIILGHIGVSRSRQLGGKGKGAAITGLVLGYVCVGLAVIGLIIVLTVFGAIFEALSSIPAS